MPVENVLASRHQAGGAIAATVVRREGGGRPSCSVIVVGLWSCRISGTEA